MKYQLICIDVDGTLYNDAKIIPAANVAALARAHAAGMTICITTGRMYHYGDLYGSLLGIPTVTISSNGAYVRLKDQVLHHEPLGSAALMTLYRILGEHRLLTHYNEWNTLLSEGDIGDGNGYLAANRKLPPEKRIEIILRPDLRSLMEERGDRVLKSISFGDRDALSRARKALETHSAFDVVSSAPGNIEVFRKGVSKARGIEQLARHLAIPREAILAIGDGENDISMLTYAGTGVAMGNATADVRAAADLVTATNNEAGLAQAVEKLCFGD